MGERKRKDKFKSIRAPESKCLGCGKIMDALTAANHTEAPKEGSIAICLDCSHIMALDSELKLRELTNEEMLEVAGHPGILKTVAALSETRKLMNKKKNLSHDEFLCEMCGGIFNKGISDEQAMKEKIELFFDAPLDECDIVCENCFQKMDAVFNFSDRVRKH